MQTTRRASVTGITAKCLTTSSKSSAQKKSFVSDSLFHFTTHSSHTLNYENVVKYNMQNPQNFTQAEIINIIQNGTPQEVGDLFINFACQGNCFMLEFMLNEGVEVDILNSYGNSALIEVAKNTNLTEVTKLQLNTILMNKNADINKKDFTRKMTPLMHSMEQNYTKIAKQFLSNDSINVSIKSEFYNKTAINFAESCLTNKKEKKEIISLIKTKIKLECDPSLIEENNACCSIQ